MARACEDPLSIDDDPQARVLRRPVRIPTPRWLRQLELPVQSELAGKAVTGTARVVVLVFPAILAAIGLIVALVAGMLAQRDSTEAVGTLGIEVGAAMWFAGAVTVGARPRPTVLRVVLIGATGLGVDHCCAVWGLVRRRVGPRDGVRRGSSRNRCARLVDLGRDPGEPGANRPEPDAGRARMSDDRRITSPTPVRGRSHRCRSCQSSENCGRSSTLSQMSYRSSSSTSKSRCRTRCSSAMVARPSISPSTST
jgi:hypothetical protein